MAIGFKTKPASKFALTTDWRDADLLRPLWDKENRKQLLDFAAKQFAYKERVVLDYIHDHAHDLATNPHDMILNGDLGAWTTGLLPNQLIRLDIPDAFLRHPRALPIELKGIAV